MNQINQMNQILDILKNYFEQKEQIVFAYIFGSAIRGKIREEGDIDIAVYFRSETDLEWEFFGKRYKEENIISLELERLLRKEVDLVVLNRARAVLADEILRNGRPIIIKDRGIFMDFLCTVSDEAEYVREWIISRYRERIVESGGTNQIN